MIPPNCDLCDKRCCPNNKSWGVDITERFVWMHQWSEILYTTAKGGHSTRKCLKCGMSESYAEYAEEFMCKVNSKDNI